MNKQIDEATIISIIRKRVGANNALTQYVIADEYTLATGEHITARSVEEFYSWKDREMKKARRQIAKIEPVRVGVIKMFRRPISQLGLWKRLLGRVN